MSSDFFFVLLGLLELLLALSLPPAIKRKSVPWFFAALGLSFVIVIVPLFIFIFSIFLTPEAKDECRHGWLDCFMVGKLALLPVGLLATAALYAVEVVRVKDRTKPWIVFGLCCGAAVSAACLIFLLVVFHDDISHDVRLTVWLLVPFYVAVWYSVRAIQLVRQSKGGRKILWRSVLYALPFWIGSLLWTRYHYLTLPESESGCFIVTAAGRGHRNFVGPFFEIQRRGRTYHANQQLIALWELENLWRQRAPRCHACFRYFYNRLGPFVAAQIRSPWLADLTYMAIKPVEWAARLAIHQLKNNGPKNEN